MSGWLPARPGMPTTSCAASSPTMASRASSRLARPRPRRRTTARSVRTTGKAEELTATRLRSPSAVPYRLVPATPRRPRGPRQPMDAVLELAGVTVRRGQSTLIEDVDWTVEEDERWVMLGPNGAGKTTLLQVASAQIHPTSGVAGILGEVLGTVDVFELRPRIGLTSAALAEHDPARRARARRGGLRVVRRDRAVARALRRARPRAGRRAAARGRAPRAARTAPSARCRRASASGCRSPAH